MTYKKARWKYWFEQTGMFPFVLLGKFYGILFPLKTKHNVFLFYPNSDIGGAPKVNADITECIKDAEPLVIFSKKYKNNRYRNLFVIDGVRIIDLHRYIDNKLFHFINFFFRGVIASWINSSANPVVFGGESLFFYKVIPHVKKNIPCIELTHVNVWLPYNIAFIERINLRICSTQKLKEDTLAQYDQHNIRKELYQRVVFIEDAIDIPIYKESANDQLQVVFIGRGSPQKRVYLTAEIAKQMYEANDPLHFSFVGDIENVINIKEFPYCTFYGNITDNSKMDNIYQQSDVLILTSAFEGLPLVVMTMMAYGKVVLSTAVNAIPDYIKHMVNGLLVYETGEKEIVAQSITLLRMLIADKELKNEMGKRSREIAVEKFSRDKFCRIYREVLLSESSQ